MKALRIKLRTYAIALLISVGFTTTSIAGSGDFAGIYGAFTGSAGGAQIDGRHVNQSSEINEGQVGGVFPLAGYEVGFNLPLGPVFFLGAGHSWTKGGTVTLAEGNEEVAAGGSGSAESENNAASMTQFSLKASDLKEVYIMPSVSIYDNSAVYVKLGRSIANLDLTGNVTGTPGNLTGNLAGIGTIAMTPSGIFIKTEGSVIRYDDIKVVGVNSSASSYVEGTPDMVKGTVAIGFKF
jgi:hypothetical protein|tara:strand:+ start:89 stop:802 length:714 start_codon:yes stop_codon:yes gene_type:complete